MIMDELGNTTELKACKPDYEEQVATLLKKIEPVDDLIASLVKFIESGNNIHRFSKISSLAELLGGLTIIQREYEQNYNRLLKLIEENN